jgi:hypothetical protein
VQGPQTAASTLLLLLLLLLDLILHQPQEQGISLQQIMAAGGRLDNRPICNGMHQANSIAGSGM